MSTKDEPDGTPFLLSFTVYFAILIIGGFLIHESQQYTPSYTTEARTIRKTFAEYEYKKEARYYVVDTTMEVYAVDFNTYAILDPGCEITRTQEILTHPRGTVITRSVTIEVKSCPEE